jgi:beta-galactosidase
MKTFIWFLVIIFVQVFAGSAFCAERLVRQHLLMDYDWKFILGDAQGAEKPKFDDSKWKTINIPYDWSIEGKFNEDAATGGAGGYLPTGIAWYRKHFLLPTFRKGDDCWIEFEGVYMNADIWVNGHHLGRHAYGYTSFYYDLSPFIKEGKNVIAVRVDNSLQPNSRWYSGSGIYRNVWINIAGPIHIAQWGTYITAPDIDSSSATVNVRTTIDNRLMTPVSIKIRSSIVNESGDVVANLETPVSVKPSENTKVEQSMKVLFPSLWSIDSPTMYFLKSILLDGERVIDSLSTPFGIRKIEYDKDRGFLLNGQHVKMHGVCLHQDAGCLGIAVPAQAWVRRLKLLKEMGCNAIRTAHNPPSPEFLDLCDKMGFLVMDEAFDEWTIAKSQVEYGYHVYFRDNWRSDLLSMIRRDRNHPSIVIWSAGNEVPEQGSDSGTVILKDLIGTFHKEDPTRPVTVANDHIADPTYPAKLSFLEMQDIVGYNYVDRWGKRRELYYSIDRHDHPNWKMIGTESVSIPSIRGQYIMPWDKVYNPFANYLNYTTNMIEAEELWRFESLHDYVIGDFMWTGIDYLGEARWPAKSSSSGVIDLCGFPKDSYYFYKSQWTNKPVLHLLPHWNWSGHEGHVIPVIAYTNCDSVELFLNGKSFGMKSYVFPQQGHAGAWNRYAHPFVFPTTSDLHLSWDVPYEPGTLKAVGRWRGRIVTEEIHTTSRPYAVRLSTDRTEINADGEDIADIKVEIVDKHGWVVPTADNLLEFKVEGEGKLAGTDNGNPIDTTCMESSRRKALNGLALVVVKSTRKPGVIHLIVSSAGLKNAELNIVSHKVSDGPASVVSLEN